VSKILWTNSILPEEQNPSTLTYDVYPNMQNLEGFAGIPLTDKDITIAEPRAFRSMSRAALLLSATCQSVESHIASYLGKDPFSVGMYAAVENGPIHVPTTKEMTNLPEGEFASTYKKLRNPKMYLKQLPNLAPAQTGIFLKIQGPLNVYTHSTHAGLQALEQAEFDLIHNNVQAALVCTAFSFEDPLINARIRRDEPQRTISEGAAAILLTNNGDRTNWSDLVRSDSNTYYGISDEIVNLTKKMKGN